ncbi:MAG TPA: molybdate ABC transporter substrate-binding protein [Acidimicrobiales bacterium]|nr:molybdate ABC transporter substrate-binding protein [Acidimicrobiales bacterium]
MARIYRLLTVLLVPLVAAAGVLTGCGTSSPRPAATATSTTTTGAPSKLTGPLTVFAAASLTEAFDDEKAALTTSAPGLALTYSFAGTSALVQQIQQGAPADVFASADQKNMQALVTAGLVEAPKTFARNKLEIAVAPGNPKHITGLADLAKSDLRVVLVAANVPAGTYSQQALTTAGVAVRPKSQELDVKSALAKVTAGEADATIVYVTDVKAAAGKADGVEIPDNQNVVATYPIAVVKASTHHDAAVAYVDEIVSGSGQEALRSRGFLPPV